MGGWRAEYRPCPICGAASAHVLGARGGRAHREGKGVETRVVRCTKCHGVYQRPTHVPEFNPYTQCSPEEYFQHHSSQGKIALGERLAAFAESVLGRPGSMLELGFGRGELLRGGADRGRRVRGVEMTEAFARIASEEHGLEIERASIESAQSLGESYDVVLLAAILEHLYEPGGECVHAVENDRLGDQPEPRVPTISRRCFCPMSLRYLLDRTGFHPIRFELHRWNIPLPPTDGCFATLERVGLDAVLSLGKLIGMGAGMTCWAVRS